MAMDADAFLAKYKDEDCETLTKYARASEAMERYKDMSLFMKLLIQKRVSDNKELSVEERNLFSVSYKNVVGSLRSSWRTINAINIQELGDQAPFSAEVAADCTKMMEKQIKAVCEEAVDLLTNHLLKNDNPKEASSGGKSEQRVFYYKMTGDYYRYICEMNKDETAKENTKKWYDDAMNIAKAELAETHPTRLGVALNFSVCYFEILKQPDQACTLAKEAFDAAIEKLDTLNDTSYKDSTLIMQLLRDNLSLWTSFVAQKKDINKHNLKPGPHEKAKTPNRRATQSRVSRRVKRETPPAEPQAGEYTPSTRVRREAGTPLPARDAEQSDKGFMLARYLQLVSDDVPVVFG